MRFHLTPLVKSVMWLLAGFGLNPFPPPDASTSQGKSERLICHCSQLPSNLKEKLRKIEVLLMVTPQIGGAR
jgi:hypothetical protein